MYCKGKPIPKIAENEIQNPCIFGTLKLFDEFQLYEQLQSRWSCSQADLNTLDVEVGGGGNWTQPLVGCPWKWL